MNDDSKFRNMTWWAKEFPGSIVDYYPENLADPAKKPFLRPMRDVLREFRKKMKRPRKPSQRYKRSRYIHWRMVLNEWRKIRPLMEPIPKFLSIDEKWMRECIPPRKRVGDEEDWPLNNFVRNAHWKIILIGEVNSTMFFHADGFSTATYLLQLVGRKRVIVCAPSEAKYLYRAGDVDTWAPDYDRTPLFEKANCTDNTIHPGEVLFYPAHWWHHTLNLDRPTIGMAGRHINGWNVDEVYEELRQRCLNPGPDITKEWPAAAPNLSRRNCAAVHRCVKMWKEIWPIDHLK